MVPALVKVEEKVFSSGAVEPVVRWYFKLEALTPAVASVTVTLEAWLFA
jgi:hypothetical protein